jgi:hypothetical protein
MLEGEHKHKEKLGMFRCVLGHTVMTTCINALEARGHFVLCILCAGDIRLGSSSVLLGVPGYTVKTTTTHASEARGDFMLCSLHAVL